MTTTNFFSKIEEHLERKLPLVAYRKPKETIVNCITQNDDQLHLVRDFTESGFVFAPFSSKGEVVLIPSGDFFHLPDFDLDQVVFKGESTSTVPQMPSVKENYLQSVRKAIKEIDNDRFHKVVLSRSIEIEIGTSPIEWFKRLLKTYTNAFCYLWYHPQVGLWLGATPEILLSTINDRFTTMSLAGTQTFKGDLNPKWGHKEIDEQKLVTKFILEALKEKVGYLEEGNLETIKAGNLMHLRTKITGKLKDNLKEVLKALHPTPAVGGLPKEPAVRFIQEQENYNREFYTGYLGELNLRTSRQRSARTNNQENQAYRCITKKNNLFVNLRCMQLKDSKALIYVGGGITKNSVPEREWEETVAKSKTILSIL
ncbi:chorismate-binding protein [Euzebyella saccharophila]|uniref:Chorismate-binding protein n=1 Tax=Euzebyella saccharophila TaxID=679664 RepID=A0ABV8JUD1_9FLAO|nr:chorismate-binding protein [Euzebyella saccharophila]